MSNMIRFRDRREAGMLLAKYLGHYKRVPDAIVLGLPRGGVVTAAEVARALGLPLDVLVVRKLGTPGHEELAMGAIVRGGVRVLNEEVVRSMRIPLSQIETVAEREEHEASRRERVFRSGRQPLDLHGRTVILVDDGLATGSTMFAAVNAVRAQGPKRIVAAIPVAPPQTCDRLRATVDEIVCLETPEDFYAVGQWYDSFEQVDDATVMALLEAAVAV
jgi:predicted phosphoribosyltransferase